MKKRLEAELISIAHRILKLKNKSEVDQLYKETQKLYETLTVLKFYGDNFETVKAEIPVDVIEEKLIHSFEVEEPVIIELEVPAVVEVKEEIVEEVQETAPEEVEETEEEVAIVDEVEDEVEADTIEETEEEEEVEAVAEIEEVEEDEVEEPVAEVEEEQPEEIEEEPTKEPDFKPAFEFTVEHESEEEEEEAEPVNNEEPKQIAFEDFLGQNYVDPVFVKPNEVSSPAESLFSTQESTYERTEPKVVALNDSMSKSISIGLNDRMGFVKFLFADSNEDYNRVLSQLSTFDTYEEAENFINDMVKPDYDNWEGKDDYAERFMEIVEQKFL